jgi:hypothetical protein
LLNDSKVGAAWHAQRQQIRNGEEQMTSWTTQVRGHGILKIVTKPGFDITTDSIIVVSATEMGNLYRGEQTWMFA